MSLAATMGMTKNLEAKNSISTKQSAANKVSTGFHKAQTASSGSGGAGGIHLAGRFSSSNLSAARTTLGSNSQDRPQVLQNTINGLRADEKQLSGRVDTGNTQAQEGGQVATTSQLQGDEADVQGNIQRALGLGKQRQGQAANRKATTEAKSSQDYGNKAQAGAAASMAMGIVAAIVSMIDPAAGEALSKMASMLAQQAQQDSNQSAQDGAKALKNFKIADQKNSAAARRLTEAERDKANARILQTVAQFAKDGADTTSTQVEGVQAVLGSTRTDRGTAEQYFSTNSKKDNATNSGAGLTADNPNGNGALKNGKLKGPNNVQNGLVKNGLLKNSNNTNGPSGNNLGGLALGNNLGGLDANKGNNTNLNGGLATGGNLPGNGTGGLGNSLAGGSGGTGQKGSFNIRAVA